MKAFFSFFFDVKGYCGLLAFCSHAITHVCEESGLHNAIGSGVEQCFINGLANLNFANDRALGVVEALAENKIKIEPSMITNGEMTDEYGYRITARMLDGKSPPTAILCSSLFIALGAVRAIYDRGLKIGSDVSLLAHDDVIPYLKPENFRVPLATTRSSIRAAGLRAMQRLIAGIDNASVEGEIWPVDLIVRESIGPAL